MSEQERDAAMAAAAAIGLTLPEPAIAGVIANRALLAQQRRVVAAALARGDETEMPPHIAPGDVRR